MRAAQQCTRRTSTGDRDSAPAAPCPDHLGSRPFRLLIPKEPVAEHVAQGRALTRAWARDVEHQRCRAFGQWVAPPVERPAGEHAETGISEGQDLGPWFTLALTHRSFLLRHHTSDPTEHL